MGSRGLSDTNKIRSKRSSASANANAPEHISFITKTDISRAQSESVEWTQLAHDTCQKQISMSTVVINFKVA